MTIVLYNEDNSYCNTMKTKVNAVLYIIFKKKLKYISTKRGFVRTGPVAEPHTAIQPGLVLSDGEGNL